ncbi:MAG: SLATT domain-containing protein [Vicinamibacteria bacterium]|nr:SLATT domain-containing protein [Vicinamibacteria bacterium]
MNLLLGVPSFTLAFAAGSAVFVSLELQMGSAGKVVVGLASLVAGVLGALHTFLRFAERADEHRRTSAKFGALRRLIEHTVACPPDEAEMQRRLEDIRRQADSIAEGAPEVPERIERVARKELDARSLSWAPEASTAGGDQAQGATSSGPAGS